MNTRPLLLATTTALALAFAAPARADDGPGQDWITLEQAAANIKEAGYADIRKLKPEDGRWEAKAGKDGREIEIHVDPHTGAVEARSDD